MSSLEPVLNFESLAFPWKGLDPFLFCVHHDDRYPRANAHLGPDASLQGRDLGNDFAGKDGWRMYHGKEVPGFPQHPHRGFETVTVVRRGLIDHTDSLGAAARYGEGDAQWLTAGRGILHSEMFPLLNQDAPNPLELFQIWINLPRADKLVDPHFTMLWDHAIPREVARDASGRSTCVSLFAGKLGMKAPPSPPPHSWASRADSDVAIWTLKMESGATWTLPAAQVGTVRTLYFFAGHSMRFEGREIPAGQRVSLRPDRAVVLENGPETAELLLLQGKPIGEPVVQYGPFVMTSREEIAQTLEEYRQTEFGGWKWPNPEPLNPAGETRFARYADGRIERPIPTSP